MRLEQIASEDLMQSAQRKTGLEKNSEEIGCLGGAADADEG
jgi:hypothetical protein